MLQAKLGKELAAVFHDLVRHEERKVQQLDRADHVHMLANIPPKRAVSGAVGCIKGKSEKLHRAVPLGERIFSAMPEWMTRLSGNASAVGKKTTGALSGWSRSGRKEPRMKMAMAGSSGIKQAAC